MANELRIEHGGRSYTLKSKLITGELIDAVTPVREKMKQAAQGPALVQAALVDDRIFEFIDPLTGDMRAGITQEQLIAFMRTNRQLMQAVTMPTVTLGTDANGRRLMAELIQISVDRTQFSAELNQDIDSQHFTQSVAKPQPTVADGDEPVERVPEYEVKEVSTFWKTFPIDTMIEYVESFCKRARI